MWLQMKGRLPLVLVFAGIMVLLAVLVLAAAPTIEFVDPTPANGSTQSADSIYVNISTIATGDHYSFVDFDRSLVGWWRMDSANSSTVFDESSYSNNGTFTGNAFINESGYWGNASWFDGVGDSILIGNLGVYSSWTISLWVYHIDASNDYAIGFDSNTGINFAPNVRVYDGSTFLTGSSVSSNVWYHIAVTKNDTTNYTIYLNGVTDISGTKNSRNLSSVQIGIRGTNFPWNGSIDEVLVFNKSLSSVEIASLYNASANKYQNNFTNLADKTHTFTGYAVDTAGNKNQTEQWIVTTDVTTPPEVTLVSPSNNSRFTSASIYFVANFTDVTGLVNDTFYLWNSTSNLINTTSIDITGLTNSTNLSVTLPYEGVFTWNYLAYDSLGNGGFADNNFTITYNTTDITPPQVTINVPLNTSYALSSIDFNVSLNENGTVLFSLNGGATNFSMSTTDNRNFNYTNNSIGEGSYTFRVYSNDTSGNNNYTESVVFNVNFPPRISITYPQNTSYIYKQTELNYTVSDGTLDTCWYSLDNGGTNTTINCGTNVTGIINSTNGTNTWRFYANDTSGNLNVSSVTFQIDIGESITGFPGKPIAVWAIRDKYPIYSNITKIAISAIDEWSGIRSVKFSFFQNDTITPRNITLFNGTIDTNHTVYTPVWDDIFGYGFYADYWVVTINISDVTWENSSDDIYVDVTIETKDNVNHTLEGLGGRFIRKSPMSPNITYVSTDGSDTNSGNSTHPYKTLGKALSSAGLGVDFIYVRQGVYEDPSITESSHNQANRDKYVVIKTDLNSSGNVTIHRNHTSVIGRNSDPFIAFENLNFFGDLNVNGSDWKWQGNYKSFENITIEYATRGPGNGTILTAVGPWNHTSFINVNRKGGDRGFIFDSKHFILHGSNVTQVRTTMVGGDTEYGLIEHLSSFNNTKGGSAVWGAEHAIFGNIVTDDTEIRNDMIIRYIRIYNNDELNSTGFYFSGYPFLQLSELRRNLAIYNNIYHDADSNRPIIFFSEGNQADFDNIQISHNLFSSISDNPLSRGIDFSSSQNRSYKNILIRNTALHAVIGTKKVDNGTIDENSLYLGGLAVTNATSHISYPGAYVLSKSGYFINNSYNLTGLGLGIPDPRPDSSSLLLNAGEKSDIRFDFFGVSRDVNNPSIGPAENPSSDTTPPTITINLPTATTYTISSLAFNVSLSENGTAWFSLNSGTINYTMTGDEGGVFGTGFNYTYSGLADASYTFNAYANDTAGNMNNSAMSVSFIVDTSTASSSSSSSGDGGSGNYVPPFYGNTYVKDSVDLRYSGEEIVQALRVKERMRIKVNGELHHVGVRNITGNVVTVGVESEEQTAELKVSGSAKFDLDSDGYYDLLVSLKGLIADKAEIGVRWIYEEIPAVPVEDKGEEAREEDVEERGIFDRLLALPVYVYYIALAVLLALIILILIVWQLGKPPHARVLFRGRH